MPSRKPRPIGSGNWTVCPDCRARGWVRKLKKTQMSKHPKVKEALAGYPCENCNATGWVQSH